VSQPHRAVSGTPTIAVAHLAKTYRVAQRGSGVRGALRGLLGREHREIHALRDLSFTVEEGEILGYIGPNGAGKSTTIKIMSGIMRPDSGECLVGGRVPWKDRIEHVRRIGVVFGQRTQLWWDLPAVESFELLKTMYRVPAASYRRNMEELESLLSLGPLMSVPVRQLSLGQRMRCEIAASLLHGPEILFLDEPTIGLDANAKIAVRGFIREYNRSRRLTVILTTHDMDDIEELSHRILVLHEGEIIYRGTMEGLRRQAGAQRQLTIDTEGDGIVAAVPGADMREEGGRITYRYDPRQTDVNAIISAVTTARRIVDLVAESEPIEHIVARVYRERGA
jgi:ABC-2 type transport system ATP-binding protein